LTAPGRGAVGAGGGLVAAGMGGLPGSFGAAGLEATGGGGAGFFPTGGGGGFGPAVLDGREDAGVVAVDASGVLFQGVVLPLDGASPGNTDTGLAEASAMRDCTGILACVVCGAAGFGTTTGAAGAVGGAGGRRAAGGGGGGGAVAAFGFGGTSSR
jgi:hypothetical protein